MHRRLAFLVVFLYFTIAQAQIRAITYNIRYNTPRDSANAWPQRLPDMRMQLLEWEFDVLGIQEGLHGQLNDLQQALGDTYRWVGVGRDSGDLRGEFCAIFYNQQKFTLLNDTSYTRWLSPTPLKPSKGWDAALPRIVTFAKFKEKSSGRTFWVFNTHFDHMGSAARYESAKLIRDLVNEWSSNEPAILLGDFNCEESSAPIQWLSEHFQNTKTHSLFVKMPHSDEDPDHPERFQPSNIDKGTFNGFAKNAEHPGPTIDHVFVKQTLQLSVLHYRVDYKTRSKGLYISDHYPVVVDLKFQ